MARPKAGARKKTSPPEVTPLTVSIGPMPEWDHIGLSSLVPGERILLVPSQDSDSLSIIDLDQLAVVKTIQLPKGGAPWYARATPDGKRAFVTNSRFNGHIETSPTIPSTVSVIDLEARKLVHNIPVLGAPSYIELDTRRNRMYVTNRASGMVSVIDLTTYETLGTVQVGNYPLWLKLTHQQDLLVVSNFQDATISLINPDTLEVAATIVVGTSGISEPYPEFGAGDTVGIAINKYGVAHIANWRSHSVVSIDVYRAVTEGRRAITNVHQSIRYPFAIELREDLGLMVVGSYHVEDTRITVLDYKLSKNPSELIRGKICDIPVDGLSVPTGKAAQVNYWMSMPFESRILGFLARGALRADPIDLVAMVL